MNLVGRDIFGIEQLRAVKTVGVVHYLLAQCPLRVEVQVLKYTIIDLNALMSRLRQCVRTPASHLFLRWPHKARLLNRRHRARAAMLAVADRRVLVSRAGAKPGPDIAVVLLVAERAGRRRNAGSLFS